MSNFRRLLRGILTAITLSFVSSVEAQDGSSGLYRNGSIVAPCDSPVFCYGEILHTVQMAKLFDDSKTFVDMYKIPSRPMKSPLEVVQADFNALQGPAGAVNTTALLAFLDKHFKPAGSELLPVGGGTGSNLTAEPDFLASVKSIPVAQFTEKIIAKWNDLTRQFNQTSICATCSGSFIAPQRPFVVAGGRFREAYYWDSYWIIMGLVRSGGNYTEISKNQILNFLDLVDAFGFVPNGGRRYYLNRSQPPLLSQMVREYVDYTGDATILDRAVPLLIREHEFFVRNRSVCFSTPAHPGKTFTLNRFAVENNQPRPESYVEDYEQVNNQSFVSTTGDVHPAPILTQAEKDLTYQNLASGAESGWDFSSRFLSRPEEAAEGSTVFPLRSYNIINIIPVELNAYLYWNEVTIARFLSQTGEAAASADWRALAAARAEAMHAVLWNDTLASYLDYNLTAHEQVALTARDADALPVDTDLAPTPDTQLVFHVGQLLPFLTGAALPAVAADPAVAQRAFARVAAYLDARAGGIPATNFRSTQQWDQPNVWPPHMQFLIDALETLFCANGRAAAWAWAHDLALRLAQRYVDSAYCTWRGTGGELPSVPVQPGLNESQRLGGLMFEKYSDQALNEVGSGGEYEVVVGFGWSNGALIWVTDVFRDELVDPPCGQGTLKSPPEFGLPPTSNKRMAVDLDSFDARWISTSAGGKAEIRAA